MKLIALGLPASQQRREGAARQGGLKGKIPTGTRKFKDPRQHDPAGPESGESSLNSARLAT